MSDIPAFARELIRLGTTSVFGIPGEGASLLLLNELEKSGCAFHFVPHEAAGALAAGGYGRLAGIPGVSLSIKGPGFSNMLAGIATNWLDRNPAVSLSESFEPGSSLYRQHKRLNHRAMVESVVKAYGDNISAQMLSTVWELCLSEPPGPVHLDISHNLQKNIVGEHRPVPRIDQDRISSAVTGRIDNARRPIVIAGALATRRAWAQQLAKLTIPVFTTYAAKGAFDETLPYSAGVFTNSGGVYSPEKEIVPKSDLVVGLGLRTAELLDVKALAASLLVFDECKGNAAGLDAAEEVIVGPMTVAEVLERLGEKEWGASELALAKTKLRNRMDSRWLPAGVFLAAQRLLPRTTMFFLDTGAFCTIGEHVLEARRPLQVTGSPQARSMGAALPSAYGAAFAIPRTPIVIVTGDGGMRLYPEMIELMVRHKLRCLVLLMTDGSYSSIRQVAVRERLSDTYLRVESRSWTEVVQAWSCAVERLDSISAFEKALNVWQSSSGPLFLELVFDPDDYLGMTEGIR